MNIAYLLKALSVVGLMLFAVYMIRQNEDERTRKRWGNTLGLIVMVYFVGEMIDEFNLLPG
jgi:NADH:ubiquinone oxidoreductase subunit 6 (subunit J)